MDVLPSIALVLESREALAALWSTDFGSGGFFVPGNYSLGAGRELSIDIAVAELGMLQFDVVVRWRRQRGTATLRAGLGVEMIHERARRVFQDILAGRRTPMRQNRRFRVSIPSRVHFDGQDLAATTRNVSRGGAFVEVPLSATARRIAELHLMPEDGQPVVTPVEICSYLPGGVGVRFLGRDHGPVLALVEEVARRSTEAATA